MIVYMKHLKKCLIAAVAAVLLAACLPANASAEDGDAYGDTEYADTSYGINYTILSRDIHVAIDESNVAAVTETMVLNYTYPCHGFYYDVQYSGTGWYYMDDEWKSARYRQRIYDFDVQGGDFELSYESDDDGSRYIDAKIGNADEIVTGEKTYVITYMADLGDNGQADFDEFYRNLFYWEYGYTTNKASFTIDLPKDFDARFVNATVGSYASTSTADVAWEKNGSTITGHMLRPLYGGEYVTLRVELPDDYFTNETNPYAGWNIAAFAVSGAAVLLALILWLIFGRDPKVYPTVEFYAPDGMTPAEAGYIIDGCVDNKDVVSLLLYWADKGYLRIEEHGHNDFELVKTQDLKKDARSYEQYMFGKLFSGRDSVSVHSLKHTFYDTMTCTKYSVRLFFEGAWDRNVFTKSSKRARGAMFALSMVPVAFTLFIYSYLSSNLAAGIFVPLVFGWILCLPVYLLIGVLEKWRSTPSGTKAAQVIIYAAIFAILFAIYIFGIPAIFTITGDFESVGITLASSVATLVMLLFTAVMRKRTQHGAEWYGKLLGFRRFIEKAEKERIEKLVEGNPSYFYNVLPYAYVLGVTDTWARKFEDIGMQPPQWYSGYASGRMFNTLIFTNYISHGMGNFTTAMVSRPPSSGSGFGGGSFGGGFGGGGFSGGGFGGGGGHGSW